MVLAPTCTSPNHVSSLFDGGFGTGMMLIIIDQLTFPAPSTGYYVGFVHQETSLLDPILIFTQNPGKIREFQVALQANNDNQPGVRFLAINELDTTVESPEETGQTFAENALIKAAAGVRQTGYSTLADDSGLEVMALDGRPGVRSSRFSLDHGYTVDSGDQTEANNALLLQQLADKTDRNAQFVCALALALPTGSLKSVAHNGADDIKVIETGFAPGWSGVVVHGTVQGTILTAPKGGGGFGYDPLFWSTDLKKTFAEATPDEKLCVSHRGRALRKLGQILQRLE